MLNLTNYTKTIVNYSFWEKIINLNNLTNATAIFSLEWRTFSGIADFAWGSVQDSVDSPAISISSDIEVTNCVHRCH